MQAIINTEILCGECRSMMQYHSDNTVSCRNIHCKERGKKYKAPAIQLEPLEAVEEPKRGSRKTAKE